MLICRSSAKQRRQRFFQHRREAVRRIVTWQILRLDFNQGLHHPIGHPHFDLIEQPIARRVKRVVQVKDPGGDVVEMLFDHGTVIARAGRGDNWPG